MVGEVDVRRGHHHFIEIDGGVARAKPSTGAPDAFIELGSGAVRLKCSGEKVLISGRERRVGE